MLPLNPRPEDYLQYWIVERDNVRIRKERGDKKPWTHDPILRDVYFCNVHREDDRVTRYIRREFNQYVDHPKYEWFMCMARIFNWPDTIIQIMYYNLFTVDCDVYKGILDVIRNRQDQGKKVWGGAYVITTHGQKMDKAEYCARLLSDIYDSEHLDFARGSATLKDAHTHLMELEGFASFMAAQVVADLKNTPRHPLQNAPDWMTFAALGPGSVKGLNYFFERDPDTSMGAKQFVDELQQVREWLTTVIPEIMKDLCNQDLQNCMCEYSKYMRVRQGGRSKRKYLGLSDAATG